MTQARWSDEQLSAFLDGQLATNETEALSRDIERDKELAARLERLSGVNAAYVAAIGAIDHEPVSPGLRAAMTPPPATVLRFRRKKIGAFVMEHRAIAAALVCAVVVWGVSSSVKPPIDASPDAGGYIPASSPLHRVLDDTPSSVAVELASGLSATPRLSFETAYGDICRQYRVDSGDGRNDAIACRKDGRWRVELSVFGPPGSGGGDYQTASGPAADLLDRFIDGAIVGAPFDVSEEERRIASDWAVRQ